MNKPAFSPSNHRFTEWTPGAMTFGSALVVAIIIAGLTLPAAAQENAAGSGQAQASGSGAIQVQDTRPADNPSAEQSPEEQPASEWTQLFNGSDLTGWTPKIRGFESGVNWQDTFRVVDGAIQVNYDGYEKFEERFGHLFYDTPYSNYVLRIEYRFTGEQIEGGPGWAIRNSGVMIHGQDPATMALDQDFPVSVEVQLLAGDGENDRPNLNVCTPGTNIVLDGNLYLGHCFKSNSSTYHGEQWVSAEIEVRGNEIIRHRVNGETVLEYRQPQLDDRDEKARKLMVDGEKMLHSGTISIQSESHPCEFRKIELRNLDR